MQFKLKEAKEILTRTPSMLEVMLSGLSEDWIRCNEGEGTWSPFDVIGHLVDGERKDWMERIRIISLQEGDRQFEPFDRFEHLTRNKNRSLNELLKEFTSLRKRNLEELDLLIHSEVDMDSTGIHPAFGEVTMHQLLSTWAVHDLNHISQITRVMAKRYQEDVGPWKEYLRVLN